MMHSAGPGSYIGRKSWLVLLQILLIKDWLGVGVVIDDFLIISIFSFIKRIGILLTICTKGTLLDLLLNNSVLVD